MANGKTRVQIQILVVLFTLIGWLRPAAAQGTAFTYQGRLNDNGAQASGVYDLRFTILDSTNNPGVIIAGPITNSATGVSNGLFIATLDFGSGVFTGAVRWLEIAVHTNGSGTFNTLAPRQQLTPTPYAIFAESVNASGLTGIIPAANLGGTYGSPVSFNNGANSFNGSFYGQFFGSSFVGGNFVGSFIGSGVGLGDVWHTSGNLNTSPTNNNFLGTTDNQPLDIRVNNTRVLRLEPDGRGSDVGNLIGGHPGNQVQQPGSGGNVIAGGGYAGVGGANVIHSNSAGVFIGGGSANQVGPNVLDSIVAGGIGNWAQDSRAVIGGGANNVVKTNAFFSVIGGGEGNIAGSGWSVTAGGYYNNNFGLVSFIGAGDYNTISVSSTYSVIGGGYQNTQNGYLSVIGGGYFNVVNANISTMAGGEFNVINTNADNSFIGGGVANTIGSHAHSSTIAGGSGNTINSNAYFSTIGGGGGHVIGSNSYSSVIAGGYYNSIGNGADTATVAGGNGNFVKEGSGGTFIGGGVGNLIGTNSKLSVIAGGNYNYIGDNIWQAAIGGGLQNTNMGFAAVVPGGYWNTAAGNYSFAAGQRAQALHIGAFVWADSQLSGFASTAIDEFSVRASGGVRFVTGGAGMTLDGQPILGSSSFAPASGSANYIQNQTGVAQAAGFNINGSGTAASLNAASVNVSGTATANALVVTNSIRVPGAGIGTTTPAFIHRATGANIETGATHRTTITHPLCDNDPNAILLITHNFSPSGVLDTHASSVYYNGILSKWQIYHDDFTALTTNSAWNVLVVKP